MKPAASQRRAVTANAGDYQTVFLRHVHCLLQLGYASMTPADFRDEEEEVISGELRRHIRHVLHEQPAARWMRHYEVHNEDPEDNVCHPGQTELRRGKDRPVIDLRFISSRTTPRKRFCIEAKRLHRGDSVSQYVGPAGLGCFLDATYARDHLAAGMLGFVQTRTPEDWAGSIKAKIESSAHALPLASGAKWEKRRLRDGPTHTFMSKHHRATAGMGVDIFHTLLVFL